MSRNLGTLTIDLIARINGFTTPMRRAAQQSRRTASDITRDFEGLSRRVIASAARMAGPLAAAFTVRGVANYATAFTELQNRLRLVTQSTQQLGQATDAVFGIAQRTAQGIDGVAQVYQRFGQNADRLGISLKDVEELTDTVSKAVAVSGASAQAAEAALVQFGQALASGVLRGEELNSVMEQTPGLAQAIANGLGVGIGALRDLAKEGRITGSEIVRALRNAADDVNRQFSTRVLTIPQAFTNIQSALTRVIGEVDTATGVTSSFAQVLDDVAKAIDSIDTDQLIRDIESVRAFAQTFTDLINPGGALSEFAGWFDGVLADNISEFVYSTIKEIDFLTRSFQSFYGGLNGLTQATWENVKTVFANAFDGIIILADEWVNDMIARVNRVAAALNLPEVPGVTFAENRRTDRAGVNPLDAWIQGARQMSSGPGLVGMYEERVGNSAILRSITDWEGEYSEEVRKTTAAEKENTEGKKRKASEGQRLIEQMREQIELMGKQTELEKLQARINIGAISFDSQRQQQEALGYAATLDFINEYTERAKEMEEWEKRFSQVTKQTTDDMGEFAKEAARGIQQSLGDGLYSVLTGNFDNIGMAFAQMLARMAADAASAQIAKALFGDFDKTGGFGGLVGSLINAFNPIRAGAGFQSGGSATSGWGLMTASGRLFAGGGYTGNSSPGNIAGLVHGQEYVFDANATKRLGVGFLDALASGKALPSGGAPVVVENHGVDVNVQRDAQGRIRVIARQMALDVLAAEGPNMVATEVGTPNRQGWKAVNQNFKVTPRR